MLRGFEHSQWNTIMIALFTAGLLCPAIRAKVHASHPDSPRRVRKVWRKLYSTKGRIAFWSFFAASCLSVSKVFACCFLRLEDSM
jgi:hypothetical protein